MSSRFPLLLNKWLSVTTIPLLIALYFASPALAQESAAAYPPLPAGYSSIRVFDREGRFVGRILPETRYWTPIERIPVFLQKALVAIEDSRFYEHSGIDVRGIARALVKDVVKGRLAEGGSTITQQLVKNKFLSGEKTIDRKLREGIMAVELEQKYTKKQILEMYFNEIYYGNGAWGIAQAARIYFDKNPEELTEAECAILAGVPKNPGRYNPLGEGPKVVARRDQVLKRMVELKMITAKQMKKLRAKQVVYAPPGQTAQYLALIKGRLVEQFGKGILESGGLDVTAALDLNMQKLAEQALRDGVRKISPELQGALLSLDTATGDLLAFSGAVDFAKSGYNRAFFAKRQPGSSIKPFIYAAAVEKGITAASLWDDTPVSYNRGNGETWTPLNYGREKYGTLPLRQALAFSNNVIAVKLLDKIGVPAATSLATRLGLPLTGQGGLSLALGTEEVTLRELVQAYTPLANGGLRSEARTIIRIFDRNRRTTAETPAVVTQVFDPASAFIVTSMLKDVMTYGTAKALKRFSAERPAAGKTGTTDDYRDAWFIGYTPGVVTGVWVGYDQPRPGGKGFTGGGVAAPIWERFMKPALAGRAADDFPQPEGVVSVTVDPSSGYPANTDCPTKRDEFFLTGTVPDENCPLHNGAPLREPSELMEELIGPQEESQQ